MYLLLVDFIELCDNLYGSQHPQLRNPVLLSEIVVLYQSVAWGNQRATWT